MRSVNIGTKIANEGVGCYTDDEFEELNFKEKVQAIVRAMQPPRFSYGTNQYAVGSARDPEGLLLCGLVVGLTGTGDPNKLVSPEFCFTGVYPT